MRPSFRFSEAWNLKHAHQTSNKFRSLIAIERATALSLGVDNVMKIQTTSSVIEQVTLATGMSYEHLVKAVEAELGSWEPGRGQTMVAHKASWDEVKAAVDKASGHHGLVIMNRLDQGTLTSVSGKTKHCVLYLVGNPVIANSILEYRSARRVLRAVPGLHLCGCERRKCDGML